MLTVFLLDCRVLLSFRRATSDCNGKGGGVESWRRWLETPKQVDSDHDSSEDTQAGHVPRRYITQQGPAPFFKCYAEREEVEIQVRAIL